MRTLLLCLLLVGCAADQSDGPRPSPTDSPPPDAPIADSLGATEVGPFESEDDYRQQRETTAAALEAAITPATASDVTACRVVVTSEQACGGPTTFAVYSSERPNAAEVERLAVRLVALDVAANAQFEWASTCMAHSPPAPVLVNGECAPDRE